MELREIFEQWIIVIAMVGGTVGTAIAISVLWELRNSLVQRLQREPRIVQLAQGRDFGTDYDTAIRFVERVTGYDIPDMYQAKVRAEIVALDKALEAVDAGKLAG